MSTLVRPTLTLNEVAEMVGVSRVSIMNWVRKGRFPKPLMIGERRRIWNRAAVERVLRAS